MLFVLNVVMATLYAEHVLPASCSVENHVTKKKTLSSLIAFRNVKC